MPLLVALTDNDLNATLVQNHHKQNLTSDQFFIEGNIFSSIITRNFSNQFDLVQGLYYKYGTSLAKHLSGEFCIIIWDHKKKLIYAFRDHLGIVPLYYFQNENTFAISSDPNQFKYLSSYSPKLCKAWPYKFLLNMEDDYCSTIDKNIKRVPNAHSLKYCQGQVNIECYWKPDFSESKITSLSEHVNISRDILIQAIKDRIEKRDNIAFETSGGLDSSALIGLTLDSIKSKDQVYTYSSTYPPNLTNYRGVRSPKPEIQALLDHNNIVHNRSVYHNPNSFVVNLEESSNILFEPSFSQLSLSWAKMYQMVEEDGHDLLFSGFGGDEFLSTRITLDFLNLIKHGSIKSMIRYFTKKNKNVTFPYPLSFIRMLVDLFGYPKSLIKTKNFQSKFNRLFLKEVTLWPNYLAFKKRRLPRDFYDRMMLTLFERFDYRLTNCYHMSRNFNVHITYPLLDLKLLKYYFTIPKSLLDFNNEKRTILREIAKGIIPESIRMCTDKSGSSNPSFLYFKHKDLAVLIDRLRSIDKNAKIHDYIHLDKVIENEQNRLKNPKTLNHNLARIYLLHLYLKKF